MKTRTNEFKNQIKEFGRQIDFKIGLHINDKLITENDMFIMTEANNHLIVEQFDTEEIDKLLTGEDIFNVIISNKGTILSTIMKEIDFEIKDELRVGDIVDCSFGLKVGEEYEWINYGKYIIYSKEYNEDTETYSYVSYDSMLLSMITFDDRSLVENVSVKTAIENICNKVGLSVNITAEDETNLPNLSKIIHQDTFKDIEMTYRDVLNMICQCLGVSMVSNNKELYLKRFNREIVDEFDEEYLKDTNVTFGEKYGPINSLVLSRSEEHDNLYRQDEESVALNGLNEFKIKDNLIMLYDDREDYIDEIFNELNGIEYYINDFNSTGITYLELLDFFNITRGDKTYKCLMLNDEIKLQQGLEEQIYTEKPEQATTDYKIAGKTDKEVSFIVDKQNGKISSKVSQNDMESYVEQTAEEINTEVRKKVGNDEVISKINQSAEQVSISAGKINLNGVVTANNNFKILNDGSMEAKNGKFSGNIDIVDTGISSENPLLTISNKNNTSWCYIYSDGMEFTNLNSGRNFMLYTPENVYWPEMITISGPGQQETRYTLLDAGYISTENVYCTNLYASGTKNRIVDVGDKQVLLNAYETPTPYFGDIGSNKTDNNGYCKIDIEEIFSKTIELDDYKVFIQECGDGNLYVEKYDKYFEVKGTPNLDFDWEIKAIQKGYKDTRLAEYVKRDIMKKEEINNG